ncbi:Hypothetical predicted protein [Mytilus galloprovincialis]|uniref:Uncharacterized protein n=1 Tax=Mytilus galloprovincialis TaxID=29158 RepID=A0A8B6BFU0_MYTGA|nr:Hypothetical predicted protein [Mytilus galloprovincialis]
MERTYQMLKREMIDMNTTLSTVKLELSEEKAKTENLQRSLQRGFTAGQLYKGPSLSSRYGGPSNTLCLPNNPETSNRTATGAVNEDAPCAVCRSHYTYASIMIPGRKSCYSGWKLEYQGYLMSNSYGYKASSYICVDNNPEFLQGGKSNQNGNLLYATGTKCGSLPCPPYDDHFAVYCVVCSK